MGDTGWRPLFSDLPRIAYVVARGAIGRGRGHRGIASDGYRELFEEIRRDERVRGVVLRIDSGGGDAVASDLLWRSVSLVTEEKPVVVSMGDVVASGGYYMASAADEVLAEAGTVTGSIGVVGGKVNLEGLYRRIGVAKEAIERGARAGLLSESRGFTPDERNAVRGEMAALYETFVDRVARGRGLSVDDTREVAQGRVWSGSRARQVGLVDAIGGPLEALLAARRRAGLRRDEPVLVDRHPRLPRIPGLRDLLPVDSPPLRVRTVSRKLKYDIPGRDFRIYFDEYGEPPSVARWEEIFAPDVQPPLGLVVDIGFGRGEFLIDAARRSRSGRSSASSAPSNAPSRWPAGSRAWASGTCAWWNPRPRRESPSCFPSAPSSPRGSTSPIPGRRIATPRAGWSSRPSSATWRCGSSRAATSTWRPTTRPTRRRWPRCSPASRCSRTCALRSRFAARRAAGSPPPTSWNGNRGPLVPLLLVPEKALARGSNFAAPPPPLDPAMGTESEQTGCRDRAGPSGSGTGNRAHGLATRKPHDVALVRRVVDAPERRCEGARGVRRRPRPDGHGTRR